MPVSLEEMLDRLPQESRDRVERRAAELIQEELTLRELRKALFHTQVEVAAKLNIKQASVVKIEQRSDLLLSTLRRYIQALGGDLEIVAKLPNRAPVRLRELGDLEPAAVKKRQAAAAAAVA